GGRLGVGDCTHREDRPAFAAGREERRAPKERQDKPFSLDPSSFPALPFSIPPPSGSTRPPPGSSTKSGTPSQPKPKVKEASKEPPAPKKKAKGEPPFLRDIGEGEDDEDDI
ncbi:MAG: hypothetical protein LBR62_03280, partial [Puniceicoccales bacterium]|nr:hypothetical protein [Puniceicoccales bacterium]